MRTSIATVCLSGTLDQKLLAAREAGSDGVEIFEPDLVAAPQSPEAIRARAEQLGLSLDLYQPFRDFESVGPPTTTSRRFELDPALMNELRELNVMYDRDGSGEFLHFYTHPVDTVFLEVVERRGAYAGYVALDTPVRLASQYRYRHSAIEGEPA